MEIIDRFSNSCLTYIKNKIQNNLETDIFFVGNFDKENRVETVFDFDENLTKYNVLISVHNSKDLLPSRTDLEFISDCSENKIGFFIINDDCSKLNVVLESKKETVSEKLNVAETVSYLSKDGPLSKIFENYEERSSQMELLKNITEVFNCDSVGVFEAGTGVGKSFAYLIPSMLWSLKNKERVVISTGTINLQQQLIEKDIPIAEKIIGQDVKAVLVKGRQNYVCLRRLSEVINEPDLFDSDKDELETIYKWTKKTKNGSKSDLSVQPPESVWQRVNSEADVCMGMRCKHYAKCFVMKMKKEASEANLLIVNHHLLFADIQSRLDGAGFEGSAVLPSYKRLVFDEAHGIEEAATSFFSGNLSRFKIIKQLNLLYRRRKGAASGFLFTVSALSECEDKTSEVELSINEAKDSILELENVANSFLGNEAALRVYSNNAVAFIPVLEKIESLQKNLSTISSLMHSIIDGIPEEDNETDPVWETKSILRRLDGFVEICKNYLKWKEHSELVFWIQRLRLPPTMVIEGETPFYFQFMQTPLSVATLMNEGIFEPMSSVVCVSATLGIENKFDFWETRSGVSCIEPTKILRGTFKSPFPYDKNMVFAIPSDAPFPDAKEYQSFVEEATFKLIKNANGKTLVLFTSYDALRKTFDFVQGKIKSSKIKLLKQGDDDRFRLLSQFKKDKESVLFATDSFWEGVDVPGESLSQVIIVKLPFGVPTDPVFSARSELIQNAGGNSFMELSVPEAVIKFRQGFGRLIRRGDDKGVVVALDRRLVEKRYGSIFTSSVPKTKRLYEPLDSILDKTKAYL